MNSKDALEMPLDEAADRLEALEAFCGDLEDRLDYFKSRGHVNPTKSLTNMMLSMLIMMLDKVQAEGLFKEPGGWRAVFEYWDKDEEYPENFPSD